MSEIKLSINRRKYVRKLVTENFNRRNEFSDLSPSDRQVGRDKIEDFKTELIELNYTIQRNLFDSDEDVDLDEEYKSCELYFDRIRECKVMYGNRNDNTIPNGTLLKGPMAPLPKYSGNSDEDLNTFFVEFDETLSKFCYPQYDKFLILKQQLSGRALTLVNSLSPENQGYDQAKKLLNDALASPHVKKSNIIKQLVKLSLDSKTDPYEYISNVTLITEAIKRVPVTIDDVVCHFVWNGLNDEFKSHVIQITNKTRPSIEEITNVYFDACERYEYYKDSKVTNSKENRKENSFQFAANVTDNVKRSAPPCSICTRLSGSDADHPLYKCERFDSQQRKYEQIEKMGGCVKCGNISHNQKRCTYRFKSRCKFCNLWHFSFLCDKNIASTDKDSMTKPYQNSTVKTKKPPTTQNMQSTVECISLLPTFTCSINGNKIRCLKDGGSQLNFVSEELIKSLKLPIIKTDVKLNVNGINGSRGYVTKIVTMEIKFANKSFIVEAISIPKIDINIFAPKLGELVRKFKAEGHKLADEKLTEHSDRISDIDFILGTRYGYVLPDTEIVFGSNGHSVYSKTREGTVLKGDIDQLLRDLPYVRDIVSIDGFLCAQANKNVDDVPNKLTTFSLRSCVESSSLPTDYSVLDNEGNVIDYKLDRALDSVLNTGGELIDTGSCGSDDRISDHDETLINYALKNTNRLKDGRLEMPLLWNKKVCHWLGKNEKLSKSILESNLKRLINSPDRLSMMNNAIKEQVSLGIIEEVPNFERFKEENTSFSVLPHMGIFKENRETTKCRIVFLSNLCETIKKSRTISHNQAIHSGPSLNQKLSSAVVQLRFDYKLLCFDICKAFNNIALSDSDSNRLLFLWFKDINNDDFSIKAYRNLRLPFGLRCSPTILMLALYKILILDIETDSAELVQLKKLIYQLTYMDNCALSCANSSDLIKCYKLLEGIFSPYHFGLQQFVSNDNRCQALIDADSDKKTPREVKLLGLAWDRFDDKLSSYPIKLNVQANTKRSILSSIASQYDPFNFNGPLLNRSRLFMHELQCNKDLSWDDKLTDEVIGRWKTIAKQANSAPVLKVDRCVGNRTDSYSLIAYADSSKNIFGTVVYLQNNRTSKMNFLCSKNRIVNTSLANKSIPALELHAISLAVGTLFDIRDDLSEPVCMLPIDIKSMHVYSDSFVALTWLNSAVNKLEKLQKYSVFVQNRIDIIAKLCDRFPVEFSFVAGISNPADMTTRAVSYKSLMKSSFLTGPTEPMITQAENLYSFSIPYPLTMTGKQCCSLSSEVNCASDDSVINRVSSFAKYTGVYKQVLKFVNLLKDKLKEKHLTKYSHFDVKTSKQLNAHAFIHVIRNDQHSYYKSIFGFFEGDTPRKKDIPSLVSQLNLFIDKDGLIRVHGKFNRNNVDGRFPLLLSENSRLSELIIRDIHAKFFHSGVYNVIAEIRKNFYIPKIFSTVKKILKKCVICIRFKDRTVKVNQSPYREFRTNPPTIPFAYLFMDYIGPFNVKTNNKVKVWLLCFTCMWSRAVNLVICIDQSVLEFLRAFQMHVFRYGLPQYCISDLGTQLVAGSEIIKEHLSDPEINGYFDNVGLHNVTFDQFFKGKSELGSMVESCVKLVKRLIYSSVKTNILAYRDFELLVENANHIVNRRPIAFKEALRDKNVDVPAPVTPENLIHGYDLISFNVIPTYSDDCIVDPDFKVDHNPLDFIRRKFFQLQKVRNNLHKSYQNEFLGNLFNQSVSCKDRYIPVLHKSLCKGDIVLIKENLTKSVNFPLGIVNEVITNVNGEATGAIVKKGKTRELTKRSTDCLIPLLRGITVDRRDMESGIELPKKCLIRKSAIKAKELIKSCI